MTTRFELGDTNERDGALYITVTVFRSVQGSEIRVGLSWKYTETISNHYWRCKDGHLFDTNGKEFIERNEETALVLAAVARWEENKAKAGRSDVQPTGVLGRQFQSTTVPAEQLERALGTKEEIAELLKDIPE